MKEKILFDRIKFYKNNPITNYVHLQPWHNLKFILVGQNKNFSLRLITNKSYWGMKHSRQNDNKCNQPWISYRTLHLQEIGI